MDNAKGIQRAVLYLKWIFRQKHQEIFQNIQNSATQTTNKKNISPLIINFQRPNKNVKNKFLLIMEKRAVRRPTRTRLSYHGCIWITIDGLGYRWELNY